MQSIIEKIPGPCVVFAGAGTGKTYTIVEKVKHLVKTGFCKPSQIVCITFSNEAAASLKVRLQRELGQELPIVDTFHAFAADLLRQHASVIGAKDTFSILTPDEAKVLLHRTLRIAPYYCHKYVQTLGTAKDMGIRVSDMQEYVQKDYLYQKEGLAKELEALQFELQTLHLKKSKTNKSALQARIHEISAFIELQKFAKTWTAYEKIKTKQNSYDYADLALQVLEVCLAKPSIANAYSYIIVDEFQDTNKLQLDFLFALAPHKNIMIVGDMNQSIYRFRGAYKENLSLFKQHFGVREKDIFTLNKSYRCSNTIGRVAYQLIRNNYQKQDECFMVESVYGCEGSKIQIIELMNAHEEARKVVEIVQKELNSGRKKEDICIMYRTHQQGRVLRKVLSQAQIPFTSVSERSLLQLPVIKVVLDYAAILDCLVNKRKGGEQAWWDLFYRLHLAETDLINIGKCMKQFRENGCLSSILLTEVEKLELSDTGKKIVSSLAQRFQDLEAHAYLPIRELFEKIYLAAGVLQTDSDIPNSEQTLVLEKLLEIAEHHTALYGSELSSFMHYLDTVRQLGIELEAPAQHKPGVRLMTLHATKGLEYPVVIITNCAEKRFPLEEIRRNTLLPLDLLPEFKDLSKLDAEEKEMYVKEYERHHQLLEERRLCYVAFTRTQEQLYLTYAGEYAGKKSRPSLFLQEIFYKQNPDCTFAVDEDIKYTEPETHPVSALAFTRIIGAKNFEEALPGLVASKTQNRTLSPSAVLLFDECQKKYEYKYVYQMPDEKTISWEAIKTGSFIHLILEHGVKSGFSSVEQYIDYARELHLQEEWASIDMREVESMIAVFFARNKDKYSHESVTEQHLNAVLGGFKFTGFADRIDQHPEGLEIIDYKTGKSVVSPKHRSWQLGYYALAAKQLGKVRWLTLDMLKQEKPLEFEVDEKGIAKARYASLSFSIPEVEQELIKTAQEITKAYTSGFKACPVEKNCEFCNEYVHGL
ncbi:ATP-dependent helicase [Candidatus Pacearchaeota archaeon]|nr:ATP-dependent helicase [Candidatus Pacearchaeota archaeon]